MFNQFNKVQGAMTSKVLSVGPNDTMDRVVSIFDRYLIHHIPVIENNKVIGIISSTDVHKLEHHFTLFKSKNAQEITEAIMRSLLAKETMTTPVATIYEGDTLARAAAIFRENLFHALPVVDTDKNLVGMLTPYDLMNYAFGNHIAD